MGAIERVIEAIPGIFVGYFVEGPIRRALIQAAADELRAQGMDFYAFLLEITPFVMTVITVWSFTVGARAWLRK